MPVPRLVTGERVTAEAFRPLGHVIPTRVPALGRRAHVAALQNRRATALPRLAVARIVPTVLSIRATALERHRFPIQTFGPTDLARYVVAVCPSLPDGEPAVDCHRALVADDAQGVNYAAGTWHHPMTVLDRPAEYVVLRWDDGTAADTEWRPLPEPVLTDLTECG